MSEKTITNSEDLMNIKDAAFLSCRFFALYVLFQALYFFSMAAVLPGGRAMESEMILSGIVCVSLIAFLCFWFKAEWIAQKIVGAREVPSLPVPSSSEAIQNAGFAIVGMLLLAKAIPQIANSIALLFINTGPARSLTPYYLQLGVEFLIGISLILGANGYSRAIKKLRNW